MTDEWLRTEPPTTGDATELFALARDRETAGDLRTAATAYDRAYALAPRDPEIAAARAALLDRLAVTAHGMVFRYIPAGTFLMGSADADPDERPVHPVQLDDYWLAETPVSWATYCDLMGWHPPPEGRPKPGTEAHPDRFALAQANKIRLQYCEDATTGAVDWHTHHPEITLTRAGEPVDAASVFGEPPRDQQRPWRYDTKPMVSVSWADAEALCDRLYTADVRYCLPTEAEWERAARGGLSGCRYPWGDEPPTTARCDFDHFGNFAIRPVRDLPPNGYGLYGMAGAVWEWTADWYDAEYYRTSPKVNPTGPSTGTQRVLRGGSWTDCAEAVTVSFRMSRPTATGGRPLGHMTPNIGFRLCRKPSDPACPVHS